MQVWRPSSKRDRCGAHARAAPYSFVFAGRAPRRLASSTSVATKHEMPPSARSHISHSVGSPAPSPSAMKIIVAVRMHPRLNTAVSGRYPRQSRWFDGLRQPGRSACLPRRVELTVCIVHRAKGLPASWSRPGELLTRTGAKTLLAPGRPRRGMSVHRFGAERLTNIGRGRVSTP